MNHRQYSDLEKVSFPPSNNHLEPVVGYFLVNGLALEFTDWADGPASHAHFTMRDDGAFEAEACVKSNQ